jgi:hypothetical protein
MTRGRGRQGTGSPNLRSQVDAGSEALGCCSCIRAQSSECTRSAVVVPTTNPKQLPAASLLLPSASPLAFILGNTPACNMAAAECALAVHAAEPSAAPAHPSHCHTPGPSARCCGPQHQQRAACPCAPALHPHPLCILPRTISRHFQHGALAPLSRGCNTNAAPPPVSPLPSAHEALCRATTPRGWRRRRCIFFRKQTKCKKKARGAARRYSTGLRGA